MYVNQRSADIIEMAVNQYDTDIPYELVSLAYNYKHTGGYCQITFAIHFKKGFFIELEDISKYMDAINELAQLANILNVCHITKVLGQNSGYADIDADEGYDFYTDAEAEQEAEHLLEVFYTGNTRAIRTAIKDLSIEEAL